LCINVAARDAPSISESGPCIATHLIPIRHRRYPLRRRPVISFPGHSGGRAVSGRHTRQPHAGIQSQLMSACSGGSRP